ncbi:MAG: RNA polymerase sigma-70 factor [Bacteroidales bacterium]
MTDSLIEKFSRGDKNAFAWIYEHYASKMLVFACGLLHNSQQAEDVVHNVFVKLWENRESAVRYDSLDRWLFTSVRNAVFDVFKHNEVVMRNAREMLNYSDLYENDNDNTVSLNELCAVIEKAIASLPPQRQKIFCLSKLSGCTNSRIAEMLGLSVNTVNNHIYAAVKEIRRLVSAEFRGR